MITQKPSGRSDDRVDLAVLGLVAGRRAVVRATAPTLLVTIEASVARTSGDAELVIDRSSCLVVPRGASVALHAPTSGTRVAVLTFREPLLTAVASMYAKVGLDRRKLERWLERLELLPRTVWVHELVHRYVFERYALGENDNAATSFLEAEILKEIYFLFRDRDAGADRAPHPFKLTPSMDRAIAYIEAHLFDRCNIAALASHARASESTLLRSFRRELGCSPAAYWRGRKLDEALVQLRAGRDSVNEIAAQVGYENPTAFAYAFRRRFGRPPSSFRPRGPLRPAP